MFFRVFFPFSSACNQSDSALNLSSELLSECLSIFPCPVCQTGKRHNRFWFSPFGWRQKSQKQIKTWTNKTSRMARHQVSKWKHFVLVGADPWTTWMPSISRTLRGRKYNLTHSIFQSTKKRKYTETSTSNSEILLWPWKKKKFPLKNLYSVQKTRDMNKQHPVEKRFLGGREGSWSMLIVWLQMGRSSFLPGLGEMEAAGCAAARCGAAAGSSSASQEQRVESHSRNSSAHSTLERRLQWGYQVEKMESVLRFLSQTHLH